MINKYKLNQNAGIFTKVGFKGELPPNMEYWALISNLPLNSWLRVGRTLPNYGLRIDDHTSFIRGGNLNKTNIGLEKEGLLFTDFYSNGWTSDQGMSSIFSSFPVFPYVAIINQSDKARKLPCLNKSLSKQGYHSSFFFGGSLNSPSYSITLSGIFLP